MNNKILIKLTVNNHSGVMSHITGLFSRRGFNLDGILCAEIDKQKHSVIYLLVTNDHALNQICQQLLKLYDVLKLEKLEKFNKEIFIDLASMVE